jgi:hypothetical protein
MEQQLMEPVFTIPEAISAYYGRAVLQFQGFARRV